MALIKCNECGHMVSDKAIMYPNYGYPNAKETIVSKELVKNSKAKLWFLQALLLCLLVCGSSYANEKLLNGGNEKDAIVELTPEFIIAIQKYDKLGSFNEGYAAVLKDGEWGYINTKGEEVISCQYSNPYEEYTSGAFHEGLAAVQKDGKWGYINTNGEEVIPISLDVEYANFFSDGLAVIINDYYNFSVIDTKGNVIFKGECDMEQFGDDMFYEMQQNYVKGKLYIPVESEKYAVYDMQGKKLDEESEEQKEDYLKKNTNVLYKIYSEEKDENNSLGLIDIEGKIIIPAKYDRIANKVSGNVCFSDGVLLVMLEEIGEDVIEGYAGEIYSPDTKYHYAYVDLKGNDTFSDEIKQKCNNSKEQAKLILKQQEEDNSASTEQSPAVPSSRIITSFDSWADVGNYFEKPKKYSGRGPFFDGIIEIRTQDNEISVYVNGKYLSPLGLRNQNQKFLYGDYARMYVYSEGEAYPVIIHLPDKQHNYGYFYFEPQETETDHDIALVLHLPIEKGWRWVEPVVRNGKGALVWHTDSKTKPTPIIYKLIE